MNPSALLAVFIGSGLGGVCRWVISCGIQNWLSKSIAFPAGTFVVNVLGCFLIGLFYGLIDRGSILSPQVRLLLTVGLCGGFTTFSTFINENYNLLASPSTFATAALYTLASLAIGLLMLYLGHLAVIS